MADEWLAVWDGLGEQWRRQILATLVEKAAQRAAADRDLYASNFPDRPAIELLECVRDGERLTLSYLFHYWEWCPAQSGSDWSYHCVYRGAATFDGHALATSDAAQLRKNYVHESNADTYDAQAVIREVRTELAAG